MGRSRTGDSLNRFLEGAFGSQHYGRKLIEGMGMDPTVLQETAPIDDGNPPVKPTISSTDAFIEGMTIGFGVPPITDYVATTTVEYRQVDWPALNVSLFHETMEPTLTSIYNLEGGKLYSFRIQNKDRWDRVSPWSDWVQATPITSAAQDIDVAEAQFAGRLTNLMDAINANLQGLAPGSENFAEGVVNAISLAQSNNSNLLTLREVDFEMWRKENYKAASNGAELWSGVWPPPLTVGTGSDLIVMNRDPNGNAYVTADAQGHTPYQIVNAANRLWLQDTRPAGNVNDYSYPFSNRSNRGTVVGGNYIASAYVRGSLNNTVRICVEVAADAAGTSTTRIESQTYSLTGTQEGQRVWVKFAVPAGKPFVRIGVGNMAAGQTVYWTRFQLEATTQLKNEPSPWTPGVFTTGVIGARMIGTLDLSAVNAIFEEASIDDARIKDLKADTIITGTLKSGERITCAGEIKAGNAMMDNGGFTLLAELSSTNFPANNKASWITGPNGNNPYPGVASGPYAGIAPADDSSPNRRGWIITASGVNGGAKSGFIRLLASEGGSDPAHVDNAMLTLDSSKANGGQITMKEDARVDRDFIVGQDFRSIRHSTVSGNLSVGGRVQLQGGAQFDPTNYSGELEISAGATGISFALQQSGFPWFTHIWFKVRGESWWRVGSGEITENGNARVFGGGGTDVRVVRVYSVRT